MPHLEISIVQNLYTPPYLKVVQVAVDTGDLLTSQLI